MKNDKAILVNSRIKSFEDNSYLNHVFKGYGELFDNQSENVKEFIINKVVYKLSEIMEAIDGCESPIETMLCIELEDLKDIFGSLDVHTNLLKQVKVKFGDDDYRLDFVLEALTPNGNITKLAIECDGHDFHEKTKEQAIRDKRRDRELMIEGYYIIRFTGSEILNDASGCAFTAMRVMKTLLKKDVKIDFIF